jgi:3-dehydroquinate dehydratase-2
MARILILNGPNLNLLGSREPSIYGSITLDTVRQRCEDLARKLGPHELLFFQSNAEHSLVDRIHEARKESVDFIIFNPAAYTHTSIALRDALLSVGIPFIELHLSNIFARERFRHRSYFSDIAKGLIGGLGAQGYELALRAADCFLSQSQTANGHSQDQEAY